MVHVWNSASIPPDPRSYTPSGPAPQQVQAHMKKSLYGKTVEWPVEMTFAGASRRPQIIVDLEQEQPVTWGVQIAVNAEPSGPGQRLNMLARFEWGALGSALTADVDLLRGLSVNVTAQTLRVSIVDESVYPAAPPLTRSPFVVSGNAVPWMLPKVTAPTRTIVPPAPFVALFREIPVLARAVSVVRASAGGAADGYDLLFFTSDTVTLVGRKVVAAGDDCLHYPIPARAAFVAFGALGANVTDIQWVFDLDL
jgi:hypothetical protein